MMVYLTLGQQKKVFLNGAVHAQNITESGLKMAKKLGCEEQYIQIVEGNRKSLEKILSDDLERESLFGQFLNIFDRKSAEMEEINGGTLNKDELEEVLDLTFKEYDTENKPSNKGLRAMFKKRLGL